MSSISVEKLDRGFLVTKAHWRDAYMTLEETLVAIASALGDFKEFPVGSKIVIQKPKSTQEQPK